MSPGRKPLEHRGNSIQAPVSIRRTRLAQQESANAHTSPTRQRGTLPFAHGLLSVTVTSLVVSLARASG